VTNILYPNVLAPVPRLFYESSLSYQLALCPCVVLWCHRIFRSAAVATRRHLYAARNRTGKHIQWTLQSTQTDRPTCRRSAAAAAAAAAVPIFRQESDATTWVHLLPFYVRCQSVPVSSKHLGLLFDTCSRQHPSTVHPSLFISNFPVLLVLVLLWLKTAHTSGKLRCRNMSRGEGERDVSSSLCMP